MNGIFIHFPPLSRLRAVFLPPSSATAIIIEPVVASPFVQTEFHTELKAIYLMKSIHVIAG